MTTFTLTSPAFSQGAPIPKRYAKDGDNISPELEWTDPPPGARSFVLIIGGPGRACARLSPLGGL